MMPRTFPQHIYWAAMVASALGLLLLDPQGAAQADAIDTNLGGIVKLQLGTGKRPTGRGTSETLQSVAGARIDGELHGKLSGQTDTGVTYEVRLQLVPAGKPRDNATFVKLGWAWGELRLGDAPGAARELSISAPTTGIGQIDGDLDRFGAPSALIAPYGLSNDNATGVTYFSPELFGIRIGLTFLPELTGGGVEPIPNRKITGIDRHRNVTETGVTVSRDLGAVTASFGAVYVAGAAQSGSRLHDLNGGALGARVVWDNLTLGGSAVFDGAGTLPLDRRPGHALQDSVAAEVNFGATYQIQRLTLGTSWAHDFRKGLTENDLLSVGADYRLAEGVSLAADLAQVFVPRTPAAPALPQF